MMIPGLQQWAEVGAERVLNAIPGGLLIAALAWLLMRIAEKQNSRSRFALLFCSLLAIAALPFVPSLANSGVMTGGTRREIVLSGVWAVAIFSAWIFVAAIAMARIVVALWRVRRLRVSAVAVPPANFPPAVRDLIAQVQSNRPVLVCTSEAVSVPTAIGFFRPVVLIPGWVMKDLSGEELKVILLHEFAHLQRWDDWTNLVQKLVRTVFFFHPAVWWIERRLTLEREMACDDVVLANTRNPQAYAECLVSLAEKSFVRRGLALAQAVLSHARETSLRLARILDGSGTGPARSLRPAFGIAAALAATCLIALPHVPRVIAFENAAPPVVASAAIADHRVTPSAIVPASVRSAEALPKTTVTRKRVPSQTIDRAPEVISTNAVAQSPDASPMMFRAGVDQETPAPQFVFVLQTTQYGENGSAIVRFSVWRVTFDHDQQQGVRQEFIVRKL